MTNCSMLLNQNKRSYQLSHVCDNLFVIATSNG